MDTYLYAIARHFYSTRVPSNKRVEIEGKVENREAVWAWRVGIRGVRLYIHGWVCVGFNACNVYTSAYTCTYTHTLYIYIHTHIHRNVYMCVIVFKYIINFSISLEYTVRVTEITRLIFFLFLFWTKYVNTGWFKVIRYFRILPCRDLKKKISLVTLATDLTTVDVLITPLYISTKKKKKNRYRTLSLIKLSMT